MKLTTVTVEASIGCVAGLVPFLAAVAGCANFDRSLHVEISSPELVATPDGGHTISVQISREDLSRIADEEIYAGIVVTSCQNAGQRYPVETQADSLSMDNFRALKAATQQLSARTVQLKGTISNNFLSRVADRCVQIEGGSYAGISVISNVLRV